MEDGIDKIIAKIRDLSMKYKYVIFVIIAISIGIYILDYIRAQNNTQINIEEYQREEMTEIAKKTIIVYIDGAITNPGVYELPIDSRVNDIINIAGGVTPEAITKNINLAKFIQDGEKIYIYKEGEEQIALENQENGNGKININTATKQQLMSLPGIGASTAQKIMTYIQEKGKLKKIEDIKNVSGIGEGKYDSIKDLIDVK